MKGVKLAANSGMVRLIVTKFGECLETIGVRCIGITQVMGGIYLHMRTCANVDMPLFRIWKTDGRIAQKLGLWLQTHKLGVLQKFMVSTGARAHPFSISWEWPDGLR